MEVKIFDLPPSQLPPFPVTRNVYLAPEDVSVCGTGKVRGCRTVTPVMDKEFSSRKRE